LKFKRILLKSSLWTVLSLFSLAMPAWGGGAYTVEQLFMLPFNELMAVSTDMVALPS